MQLKSLFTHRLIRVMRILLPLVVIGLIGILIRSYWSRSQSRPSPAPTKLAQMARDLALLSEGFTVSRTEGNRTLFTIHARTQLSFTDKKSTLQDVDVTIFGKQPGDPVRRVTSKECSYDQETEDFRCMGDVELQLDDQTTAHTQDVNYNHATGIISAPTLTRIERPGVLEGQSNNLEYSMESGLVRLNGAVRIHSEQGVTLRARNVVFNQQDAWATAEGAVTVQSPTGTVRGDRARATLTANTYQPKTVVMEGSVLADSAAWKLQAGWANADFSPSGSLQRVLAKLDVHARNIVGPEIHTLVGEEVEAAMDATGKATSIEARNHASADMGSGGSLESDRIWIDASGGIETKDASTLRMGDKLITGKAFVIRNGDIVTFKTGNRATLKSSDLETSSDETDAKFDSRTGQVVDLVQTGNVVFKQGERTGRARRASIRENGAQVALEGSPTVSDSTMKVEGSRIDLNQTDNSFLASGNVRTLSTDPKDPFFVMSERASGRSDAFVYDGNVQLWRGNIHIVANHVEGSSSVRSFHAAGNVRSDIDLIHATAKTLDYDDASRTVHYTGEVKARKQGMEIQSAEMTAKADEANRFSDVTAAGGVIVTNPSGRATGDRAVYTASNDQVILTGPKSEARDKKGNIARGARLVVQVGGDRMAVIEGGDAGKTTTTHAVKKN